MDSVIKLIINTTARPDFMTPTPVSSKKKDAKIYETPAKNIPSILGKRKFDYIAYGEMERYGQYITDDFFVKNIGHGVYQNNTHPSINGTNF